MLGGVSAHQNGTNVWNGIKTGMKVGAMLSTSIILTVGSFYVPGGLSSNLGLIMFTYGYTTASNMLEVGFTQANYSMSKDESWFSNITNAMYSNSGKIYGLKAAMKTFPLAQHFTWHIGEEYKFTIPGEGGVFNDRYTIRDAWGMFKNYLGDKPKFLSNALAIYAFASSTFRLGQAIFGEPNYNSWILY